MEVPVKTFSGCDVPVVGLGTWKLRGEICETTVRKAVELGYRHIDTAAFYQNESRVGDAISHFDRERLFITTKVWKDKLEYSDFKASAERSLDRLGLGRVDLLLIHWPNPDVPLEETISAMNDLVDEGKVSHIGVSNFEDDEQLDLARELSDYPIVNDQVEYHVGKDRSELLDYCRNKGVGLTAYSPLAQGGVIDQKVTNDLAAKYGKSPGQVALKWLVEQENVIAIPKASSEDHLRENLNLFDWEMEEEDLSVLEEVSL
ncbi:MAG: aldo/keto reductase [Candidatus Bipolaricaulota bacterium]